MSPKNIETMFDDVELELEPEIMADEDLGNDVPLDVEFEEVEVPEEKPEKALAKSNAVAKSSGLDFNFADLGDMPGVMVGDIGIELSRYPVEKARFTKDSRTLLSIVSSKVVAVKTHYNESLGSYLCWGGKCCEVDGLSRVKYLFPVVVYDTDKRGAPVSTDLNFRVLAVGKETYDDIRTMMDLNGDITKFDLVVVCKDEQYQKISLTPAGEARWRKNKSMVAKVSAFWKENMQHLLKPIARKITENDLMKSGVSEDITATKEVDFSQVFADE